MRTRLISLRHRRGTGDKRLEDIERNESDVFGIGFVFSDVAGFLAFEIHFVLLHIGLEDIVSAHAQNLRSADEKVKKVDYFDASVLIIELLVFGPPFPRNTVGKFGNFLGHGAAIIEDPFCFFLIGHGVGVDADALVEGFLHSKKFAELIRLLIYHAEGFRVGEGDARGKVSER